MLSAGVLFVLFVFAKTDANQEAEKVELAIDQQFVLFDEVFSLIKQDLFSFHHNPKADFIVYNEHGKLLTWTDHIEVPLYEQFLLSSNNKLLTTPRGEYLFKLYETARNEKVYKVVVYSLVRRTFDQKARPLPDQYNRELISENIEIGYDEKSIPVLHQETQLFNIQWSEQSYYSIVINRLILFLLVLMFIGCFITIYQTAKWVKNKKGFSLSFLWLIGAIGLLRIMMGLFGFPSLFIKLGIFAPSTFRFEWFFSTLGDSVLNIIGINLVLVYAISQWRISNSSWGKLALNLRSFCFALAGYFSLYLFADSIQIILDHSQISLDISASLMFSTQRILAYILVALMALFYFLQSYLAFEVIKKMHYSWKHFLTIQGIGGLIVGGVLFHYSIIWMLIAANLLYVSILFVYQLPTNIKKLKFESLNYLILSAVLLSSIGSIVIYKTAENKEFEKMNKFATYLRIGRDLDGEHSLYKALQQIEKDVIINARLLNPRVSASELTQRIEHAYLNTYFNNYEISLILFDKNGQPLETKIDTLSIDEWKTKLQFSNFETVYPNIYYDGSIGQNKRQKFTCLATMRRYESITGYLKIELRLKKFSSKRVLPQLLMSSDQKTRTAFDYGVFLDSLLVYKSGDFDYESNFDKTWLDRPDFETKRRKDNQYLHIGSLSGDRKIVITSTAYSLSSIVSNFSFLFVVLLSFGTLIVLSHYVFYPRKSLQLNFSTKILLYTGASFIIPLALVGTAVMTSTDISNRKEIDKSNLKKAGYMTENLNDYLTDFNKGKINKEVLENSVARLSEHAGMEINIFGKTGRLLASSTPEIFNSNILSPYLTSRAMDQLVQKHKESLILDESIGSFQFKTAYVSILSQETGAFLGVLGAPYFASKNHLKRQQLEVFGNIINIFTFVFILSILIAYFIISKITKPIMAIADRLHDTGFVETNQPIVWDADDEIGLLVKEYNNMLGKLEISKQELAQIEKEAAWREMAKQVAHEIKNPLTPMKLTIQHLQRLFDSQADKKKSLDILLSQIDTLDEIVTSFSHFAKMPTPESEPFDIKRVLERSIDLHVDKEIEKKMSSGDFLVMGDKKLFGRIFNNLILNAFQAMKHLEHPLLVVQLSLEAGEVKIAFEDQGDGIPKAIRDKVFTPNFSTKETGSGIGLAVAKRGVEHAGGTIYFETEMDKGTSFFMKIPLSNSLV